MLETFLAPGVVLLGLVSLERLGELWLARRNTAKLMAQGAHEVAPGHYPAIVVMHGLWLVGLWIWASQLPLAISWVALFLVLQFMRIWVLWTLGARWTTRIIVLPGETLVRNGPYRFVSHPNYLVVIGEIAVLPLCFGLVWYGVIFSAVNAAVLAIRIKAENEALARIAPAKAVHGEPH